MQLVLSLLILLTFKTILTQSNETRQDRLNRTNIAMAIRKEIEDMAMAPITMNLNGIAINFSLTLMSISSFNEEGWSKIKFALYTRRNLKTPQYLGVRNFSKLEQSSLERHNVVKVIIHGWLQTARYQKCLDIKNIYLKYYDYNIIIVDWGSTANTVFYPWVVSQTKDIGGYLAKFLTSLIDYGVDRQTIHLIGHGIGAHIAGFAAEFMMEKPARITGLDPALPGFFLEHLKKLGGSGRLKPSHAKFVDCIHTNGGFLGMMDMVGDADFYPNQGQIQPGCSLMFQSICSHERAYRYFAESIADSIFPAKHCVPEKSSLTLEIIPMGNPTPFAARGVFCLKTNAKPPFGVKPSIAKKEKVKIKKIRNISSSSSLKRVGVYKYKLFIIIIVKLKLFSLITVLFCYS